MHMLQERSSHHDRRPHTQTSSFLELATFPPINKSALSRTNAAAVLWCRSLGEGSFSPSAFARLDLQPLAPSQAPHSLRGAYLKPVENPR